MTTASLVGRDAQLRRLRAALQAASAGAGDLVLVTGEAGIGKTSVVGQVAGEARAAGAVVVSGACWDGAGVPGYWPWTQVVRAVARTLPVEWPALRADAGEALSHLLAEPATPATRSGGDMAFHLGDSVTRLLTAIARQRPAVVVVEDLHWADLASLRLLEFLVHHTRLDRVLVLATYRDSEVAAAGHPLREALAALSSRATVVELDGLDPTSCAEIVRRTAGAAAEADELREIHARTGGNPFFVEQLARLRGRREAAATPAGVRGAIDQRLALLAPAVEDVLVTAALLGADVDGALLAAATPGATVAATADLLAHAVGARLLVRSDTGSYAFVHDLVREALVDRLDAADARRRHAAVVRAAAGASDAESRLLPSSLAAHAIAAVPEVDAATAARLSIAAAVDASRRLAVEEAVAHYERAVDLLGDADRRQRSRIALRLGVERQRAGDLGGARAILDGVLADARSLDDTELFGRAVLAVQLLGDTVVGGRDVVDLVDEAYEAVAAQPGDAHGSLAAELLAASARIRTHRLDADRDLAERLSARAVEQARSTGDDAALGMCLLARHDAIWRPGTARERVAIANELVAVAARAADRELELTGALLRAVGLLEQGDQRGLDALAAFVDGAERSGLPRMRWMGLSRRGTVQMAQGDLAGARDSVDAALDLGARIGEAERASVWADQAAAIARLRGRDDELDAAMAEMRANGEPHVIAYEAVQAAVRGDVSAALGAVGTLEDLGARWPRWARLVFLATLAEVAAATGDRLLCARVRQACAGIEDQWAVLGGAVVIHGPMALWAGMLDAASDRWDQAVTLLTAAQESADRLGLRPWAGIARLELALALRERAGAGDVERADELLESARVTAAELGMARLNVRVAAASGVRTSAALTPAAGAEAGTSGGGGNEFRFDGDLWTLTFAGRTARLPDAKGLRDLRTLLAQAGRPVPAAVLAGGDAPDAARAARSMGSDAVIDDAARREYRQRLGELDAALAAAAAQDDMDAAAAAEEERAMLLDELRRATGLGGRPRNLGDESERVRKTVTARIRDSMSRLDRRHPQLAAHLRATISTGSSCLYAPGEPIAWHL